LLSMKTNFLEKLNIEQKKAVSFKNQPLLILAGAGSGKTRVLTYRAAWLVLEKGIDPQDILLVTFTNKAAAEMKGRISKLLTINNQQPATNLPFSGTFHSFCARFLRIEGKDFGIPPGFTIYDTSDQLDLVKQIIKNKDLGKFKPGSILNAISSAKNELLTPLEYLNYAKGYFTKTAAEIYLEYQKSLNKYHALDFDDLLFEAVKILNSNSVVLSKYQHRYQYVLVDEYQDTNHAQYELTKLLSKGRQNLTVVGDCSQSIYSWRGADFRNVLKLEQDFPNLTTINLERNYRSSQNILNAAFSVINKNKSHPILKLWTDKKNGPKITLFEAEDEKEEADFIIKNIQKQKSIDYQNFAVLYRTNAQSRVIEEAFLSTGIPYILVGGTRFYERKEIKDCLAYVRLLANPVDMVSYHRIEKLGKRRLNGFENFAGEYSLVNKKTVEILDDVLEAAGYLKMFDKKDEADRGRIENIKELRSVAEQFPKLADFLENVALIEKESKPIRKRTASGLPVKSKDKRNAVTLMTLHAAKGLEFDTVFMIGMEEGLFPHSRSMLDKQELEEERRLCYVGITRTKNKLYLTHTARRLYFGRRSSNEASRFINDLPEELMEAEYANLLE